MKATGIVRKVDELGRVVIPKEIRKVLKIKEGNSLEIYSGDEGEIILKKYAPIDGLIEISKQYLDALYKVMEFPICVTDGQNIVAVSGASKMDYLGKELDNKITKIIEERSIWISGEGDNISIIKNDNSGKYYSLIVAPIISDADIIGSIIVFSKEPEKKIGGTEYKLLKVASDFLGKSMEI
jgi:AbrB family transcriptional regulator (stage V sporulation protein T)